MSSVALQNVMDKLSHVYSNNQKLGMIYTFVKQGVLQSKDFKELVNAQINKEVDTLLGRDSKNEEIEEEPTSSRDRKYSGDEVST